MDRKNKKKAPEEMSFEWNSVGSALKSLFLQWAKIEN